MTREARALWSAHGLFVLLTIVVAYDLWAIWSPVLGGAS